MVIKIIIALSVAIVVFNYCYGYFWGTQKLKKTLAFLLALVETGFALGFLVVIIKALEGEIDLGEDGFQVVLIIAFMFFGGVLSINNKTTNDEMEEIYQRDVADKETRICPFCHEEILAIAEKCRYCSRSLIEVRSAMGENVSWVDEGLREVDIIMDMDTPGLAANPDEIPQDEIDRRSAVWFAAILIGFSLLAGILYLLSR